MTFNPMDLTGRSILVTGASSGIGRETAILLSQMGARLALAGRNRERLEGTLHHLEEGDHLIAPFDFSSTDGIDAWLKTVVAGVGPLGGLVHSAGIHQALPLRVLSSVKLEEILRVNVTSAMMLAKAFRQRGCSSTGSSLVYLSSVAGIAGQAGISSYSASKAAIIGLTRSLALELARDGIRVNCVAPGYVASEMTERFQQMLTPEQFQAIVSMHPLGIGRVRDVAHAIAFLLADTSRWITGSTLVVDGGYSAQ